jgi:hypothetical protein
MTEKHWIKFYGVRDLITHSEMEKVRHYVEEFNSNQGLFNLNEVIQLHNILKYLETMDEPVTEKEKAFQGNAKQMLGRYFSDKGLDDLSEEYSELYNPYVEDFWAIFVNFGGMKKTTVAQFDAFALANDVYIGSFLAQKAICEKYKETLKTMLLREPRYFELFLKKYDSADAVSYEFPPGFTHTEINEWASSYCDLPDANINYLQQLSLWSKQHEYKIEDKVLVKAKKTCETLTESFFSNEKGLYRGISVSIKPEVPEGVVRKELEGNIIEIEYGQEWFDNERDYPTLLQNLIYVFNFFDDYGRFTFIGSEKNSSSFIDLLKTKRKYAFSDTVDFRMRRNAGRLSFLAYFEYLSHNNIDMEELFSYCFNELFSEAYKIDHFFFHSSSKENNFYTRSKALLPEMDSVLKQFDMYQQDGEIDLDLFELKSTSNGYRNIKSLTERKFVYLNSEETKRIIQLIFEDRTGLSYIKNKGEGKSFYKHVLDGIKLSDFNNYQRRGISDTLEATGLIGYDDANRIYFKNNLLVNLYGMIFTAGYCSILNFYGELLQLVEEEVKKGNLRYGNTLFSEQESDYISYIMDDKKYSNTLAIRNKITHGSFAKKSTEEHKEYYLELLMILMMYTIRINNELDYQDIRSNPEYKRRYDLADEDQ